MSVSSINLQEVLSSLSPFYSDLSSGALVHLNIMGEPFFVEGGAIVKISPEDGEKEVVCKVDEFDSAALDDYFSAISLMEGWVNKHGGVPKDSFLVPLIPFVLGGEFSYENLRPLDMRQAAEFYRDLRQQINGVADGQSVEVKVIK